MKVCEVKIFGQTYSLRADMDEEEVKRVAQLVDGRMREVAQASPSASALQVAVLAALDIAGENNGCASGESAEAMEAASIELMARVDEKTKSMLAMIEAVDA